MAKEKNAVDPKEKFEEVGCYQAEVPCKKKSAEVLVAAAAAIMEAKAKVAKKHKVRRKDLAVVGPYYYYRAGRLNSLLYRIYYDPLGGGLDEMRPSEIGGDVFDPWRCKVKSL